MSDSSYAIHLAHLILGRNEHGVPSSGIDRAADATVRIEMEGMIKNIVRSIHFDGAEIAQRIEAELLKQCSEVNIEKTIRDAVKREIDRVKLDINHRVAERVQAQVSAEIDRRAGEFAKNVAKRAVDKLIKEASK